MSKIQFDESKMRASIANLRTSAKELRNVGQQMRGVARNIQNGGLEGDAGSALFNSVNQTLFGKCEELAQKLEERARVEEAELEQMLAAQRKLR